MARATLLDFFQDFADGKETFLVYDDGYRTRSYTYRQVGGAASAFAQRLTEAGIGAGERVVIWGENRPEWVACFWGCLLVGVVVVPVDYRTSLELLERIVGIVEARAVVAGADVPAQSGHWRLPELDWSAVAFAPFAAEANDLCEIIFTSGATADPKGVTITHANVLANVVPVENEIRKYLKWSVPFRPIRFLNLLPLSHMFGQSMATFIPPVLRGEVVFMAGFNPREIIRQIHTRRISVLVSVPKILEVLRDYVIAEVPEAGGPAPTGANWMRRWWHFRRVHDLFGWKFWSFIVGAAPLSSEVEEFWSKLGFLVVQGYGLTETAPIVTLNHPFHTSKGSVGKPIGGVEVKIAGDGEILVRGPNVTRGYYGASDGVAFEDGWFHTGDIGTIDDDGRVFVRGRKKEMIVTPDGLNIFPEDVEKVLDAEPGVREAAAVGTDAVRAVLVLDPGVRAEDVVAKANEKLESHQLIRGFSIWTEGPLPRTEGTGKLKRVALRDWVAGTGDAPVRYGSGEKILGEYADDTPLAQLGLSSLERVELMMQAERNGNAGLDESAFARTKTVGELRALARREDGRRQEPAITFPRWTRTWWAQTARSLALPTVLLPLLRLFVWLRVEGRENLDDVRRPVLFAVNHQSILDVPTVLAALPWRLRYRVATAAGMDWFRPHYHPEDFGLWERFGNNLQFYLASLYFHLFPIPQREAGARETLRYMGELVNEKWSVLIFPEGVRTKAGEIAPFQAGVGMIGSRLGIPVVPVRISGLDRVLHSSARFPTPGRVEVVFGKPLKLEGGDYAGLAEQVERAVRDA